MAEDDEPPLTNEELIATRRIIRDDEVMAKLWALLRLWAGYLSAGIIAVYGAYEAILKIFHKGMP